MSKVLIAIAEGSEEVEFIAPIDLLRRAGATVTLAKVSISPADAATPNVKLNNGVVVIADSLIEPIINNPWDMILIPGGFPGTTNLAESKILVERLKKQKAEGKWIAAICAAPALVLAPNGILDGEKATSYPSLQTKLPDQTMAKEHVVISHKIITSQAPGTAMAFALATVQALFGEAKAEELKKAMVA